MAAVTLQIVSMSHTDYCLLGLFVCLFIFAVWFVHTAQGFFALHVALHDRL